ncbi:Na/Pi cotransporter family protein [Helicobacter cinaedi]|uniref:Na+/Pi-cotransporter n=1 Tax=Helicobacter cinaedi CCUG 18818 = ATCC BAA-847 TaxID=537971 RepID=A0AAI8MHT9_9HELI|nr:Na/Pi symporter [Helicobacter cinaedi]EFR47139.1 putative Na/Pi-cotransporter II-like protein [Helicobacter cinaedi CCUG 18818 = ATCC BAA-847]QOQ90112.1 Na/Pi cotransporter family protein [Helicobacter cinaedi]BAM31742.1 Na+/Pi-cotransporter [Helicobacter cinaedi CCUG 18818 = ATCC BAA-847]
MFQKYLIPLCIVAIIYLVSTSDALTNVSAGLAILLFGMLSLGSGFRAFNGGFLENLLTSSTSTAVKSITFGTIATAVMQSSSLVSVLSISFVSAALLSLTQGIGVMFGANLGNSAGSWLIAGVSGMKISALALPLIVGGVLFNFQSSKAGKGIGQIFIGIGFFFLGVGYIKDGFEEYKEVVDFSQYAMEGLGGVLLFVGLGALMTAIVQSSHATLTIIISAFAAGSMSYENALAATLGTSVGGVMTAVIASLSTNIDGKRLAVANCIFNFSIVLLVIAIFDYFVLVNSTISMLLGLEENSVLRIAVFHTLFNLVGVVLLLPLIPKIAIFLESVMKDKDSQVDKPLYVNDTIVQYQDTAFIALTHEVYHLYENAFELISHALGFSRQDIKSQDKIDDVLKARIWAKEDVDIEIFYIKKIKVLFNAILDFSTEVQTHTQDKAYIYKFAMLTSASRHIVEAIKNMELLQPNLKKNSLSQNKILSNEYNALRTHLALLLRSIEEINTDEELHPQVAIIKLKAQKKAFKKIDKDSIVHIESMLSKKDISVPSGTSLLNAVGFSHNIAKELANAMIQIQKTRLELDENQNELEESINDGSVRE